jgi:hypothetical protein
MPPYIKKKNLRKEGETHARGKKIRNNSKSMIVRSYTSNNSFVKSNLQCGVQMIPT